MYRVVDIGDIHMERLLIQWYIHFIYVYASTMLIYYIVYLKVIYCAYYIFSEQKSLILFLKVSSISNRRNNHEYRILQRTK